MRGEYQQFVIPGLSPQCGICELPVLEKWQARYPDCAPQLDHIVPRTYGGDNGHHNMQVVHHYCNRMKAGNYPFTPHDFWYLESRLRTRHEQPLRPFITERANYISGCHVDPEAIDRIMRMLRGWPPPSWSTRPGDRRPVPHPPTLTSADGAVEGRQPRR